nr:MAG TPA: hypothetical protein [Caudoviricetes sp.]
MKRSRFSSATPRSRYRSPRPAADCRRVVPPKENRGASAYRHPRLREYPGLRAVCRRDCRSRPSL